MYISARYGEITACLNRNFRDSDSKKANTLQVGSYGRWTGIRGISDLDMLYIMPASKWDDYKDSKQRKLLTDIKDTIKARYPKTDIRVDRCVVCVQYVGFKIEVQPVFEQADASFKYPDTASGGAWKNTKPRAEIQAMKEFVDQKNKNLRKLCKMARAWKNKHGVGMGGLLLDTLAYNFLKCTDVYDDKSYSYYGLICRDFFQYLSNEPNKDYYLALGSNQRVNVKNKFQRKAKKAYDLTLKAIESRTFSSANQKWKKVFGRPFPNALVVATENQKSVYQFNNTEEFIEDMHPVDIRYTLKIECEVSQNGFREYLLRTMLAKKLRLKPKKKLNFYIDEFNVPGEFIIKWKVLNRGHEAERKDCIRGDIVLDEGFKKKEETTSFNGEHIVECYAIQNDVVVAKDRINVPIQGGLYD